MSEDHPPEMVKIRLLRELLLYERGNKQASEYPKGAIIETEPMEAYFLIGSGAAEVVEVEENGEPDD